MSCPKPDVVTAFDEGVLPSALAAEVESHLRLCRTCAKLRADLRQAAFAEPTLGELARLRGKVFGGAPEPRPAMVKFGVAAAVAAMVFAGVYFWRAGEARPTRVPAPAEIADASPLPPLPVYRLRVDRAPLRLPLTSALVLRGQSNGSDDAFLRDLGGAMTPYRSGLYSDAAKAFAALRKQYPQRVEPPFYEGVAALLAQDFSRAIEPLQAARAIGGEALHDDIAWYLAAAWERMGDWTAATPLLNSLCRAEGTHQEAACAALSLR